MGKKVKKKKAGMAKRQQQKRFKKAQAKRRLAGRTPKLVNSYKGLQKVLSTLPTLAFATGVQEIQFNLEELKQRLDQGEADPHILTRLITGEVLQKLHGALTSIEARAIPQSPSEVLAKATIYALEHSEEIPLFMNPLLIGMYLRDKATVLGTPLQSSEIIKAVQNYEDTYGDLLQSLSGESEEETDDDLENVETDTDDHEGTAQEVFLASNVLDEFLSSLSSFSEAQQARIEEDVEVFLEDYADRAPDQWNAEYVDAFLGKWVIENLNPMVEDVVSMQNSLQPFFMFLQRKSIITESALTGILPLLADKAKYTKLL